MDIGLGERMLLTSVALALGPGQRVAVVGPSGAGKTLLLRALAGLDQPAAGTVSVDGQGPAEIGYPRWRRRVMYVGQRAVMFPGPVEHNLRRPFTYATAEAPFPAEGARAGLAALGLAELGERPARDLSEGERQRVGLLRALLCGPSVVLLDEPTSALDPAATEAVEHAVRAYTDAGAGAIVVTHDPAQARRWCTDTLDLREHVHV